MADQSRKKGDVSFPFDASVGYQVRVTHRLIQRFLQQKIQSSGVTLGMWYFLRALWDEDGLTQTELSERVGTMEPTALDAIKAMGQLGIVHRVRNPDDKRKINIYLTEHGWTLKKELLPEVRRIHEAFTDGLSPREIASLLGLLKHIQGNLLVLSADGGTAASDVSLPP